MPIYNYQCPEGHITEAMVSVSKRKESITCKACNSEAHFIVSAPSIQLDGTDPGFPDAYDKWAKVHENASSQYSG